MLAIIGVFVLAYSIFSQRALNTTPNDHDEILQNLEAAPAIATIAANLEAPWEMDFLPDGTLIVTERPGAVKLIDSRGMVSEIARLDLNPDSERGLHGVAVDPNFSENKKIYLHYTYLDDDNNVLNRVVRYTLEDNSLIGEEVIIDQIPGSLNHDGGRIKFGPDGFLYITAGDAEDSSNAQDITNAAGTILRATRHGDPAPGNPFGDYIYAYGLRNPQGITWDDQGNLWATDHGRSGDLSGLDELNLIEPGKNYGWPEIEGDESRDGMEIAVIHSGPDVTWAPAGAQFLNGSIFFTGLRGETLYEYKISEQTIVGYLKKRFGRFRNVVLGPDGLLYVATSNRDGRGTVRENDDKILKINPTKLNELN